MGRVFTRKEIHDRFAETLRAKQPLVITCAGSGLNAKSAEAGGVDMITLLYTGLVRQKGLPSIAALDGSLNDAVKTMLPDQFRATRDIPICCGVDVGEFPADGDLNELLDSFLDIGFSGVVNFPSSGEIESPEFLANAMLYNPTEEYEAIQHKGEMENLERCKRNEANGVGYDREIEMIRLCNERDVFSLVYVFTPEQAAKMAQAGADVICGHCGGTRGGLSGHKITPDYQTSAQRLQNIFEAALAVNPGILLLGHGGPFSMPKDTRLLYELTSAHGFLSGSAIDRIPIEEGIMARVKEFKEVCL